MSHIECRKLSKAYRDSGTAKGFRMEGLDLDIPDGKVLCVLGPSGSGKSTLLKIIAGLEPPDSGRVIFDGMDMSLAPPAERGIGMVFQDYALYPHLSARQNILSYFFFRKKTPELEAEAREKYERTAELLGVDIEYLLDRMPPKLSGGEKQRVALGRCITRDPRVLLLDEPFSNLDAKLRRSYCLQLKTLLARYGVTTVFVTHDQREALILADLIAIMRDGGIEQAGSPREIYDEPRSVFAADFLNPDPEAPAMCFLPGQAVAPEFLGFIVGARSEDISIRPESGGPGTHAPFIRATVVDARELPLGAGTMLTLLATGREFYVKARKENGPAPAPGSTVLMVLERCHLFDENTRIRARSLGR